MDLNNSTLKAWDELYKKFEKLSKDLENFALQKHIEDKFLDNQEFIQLMHISKRTAQAWRDEGKISFSQIGSKIYYKMKDVEVLLNKNYNKSFKNKR